jgi:molecular chaperone DnaJ
MEVETVDGSVSMRVPIGTQSGTDFKLSGHGVPRLSTGNREAHTRGAHIVTIIVDTPSKLSKDQTALLKKLRETEGKKGLFR